MKRLFVIVFVLAATVSFAVAQPEQGQRQMRSAEERAKNQTERMITLLSLNADQKAKIEAIELELGKDLDAKRQSAQGNREAMMEAFQEIDKVRDDKYKIVLTADQFKKYLDDKAQRPQRPRGPGGGPAGAPGGGQGNKNK